MSRIERKTPDDILRMIDAVVPKPSPSPFEFEEVKKFTDWIYMHISRSGRTDAGDEISGLKDSALILILDKKNKEDPSFPGRETLLKEYKAVKKMENSSVFSAKVRDLRNKALSHILLTDLADIPENNSFGWRDEVLHIQEKYGAVRARYSLRYEREREEELL